MPYHVARSASCPTSRPFAVLKTNGESVGCHATEGEANQHMAALYANIPDVKMKPVKATVLDDDKFRLLAIPFGGPIPRFGTPGVDLDGEWFTPRTDIKADWLPFRLVDWHHGHDRTMARTVIGKADNLIMDEEGWWVDVWLKHGERRLELIRRLADAGANIFGSSESVKGLIRKASTGEIMVWPYFRQTLSTSPQNTYSIIRPLKATLDDLVSEGISPSAAFWSDIESAIRNLSSDLRGTSSGDLGAKAGRVFSAQNESELQSALTDFEAAMARVHAVLSKQTPRKETM